ncbi:MAG TPA: CUAEP/CCAEP-tail radical SAM protein, partial [Myxococcales bacterium]|nr:CUAEP/CCAEP-tail radical SAM protein [Myxococcales bacterium]
MRSPGEILVISCYELGRQPLAAAGALAALETAGFSPAAQDISVERLSDDALRAARLVLISVPMHTALQLGVRVAARARAAGAKAAFFGLYAALNAGHLL